MSDPKHPIDDLFGRNLAGYEAEPPLHLWANIAREQKRRRKPVFWYWAGAGAAVLGAMALSAAFLFQSRNNITLGAFPVAPQKIDAPVSSGANLIAANPVSSAATASAGNSSPVRVRIPAINLPALAQPAPVQPEQDRIIPVTGSPETQISGSGFAPAFQQPATAPSKTLPRLELQPLILPAAAPHFDQPAIPSHPTARCARFKSGRPVWFAELTGAPTIAFRELDPVDPEFGSYARSREETESSVFSFSAAGRVSLVFPWGLSLRSGVQYTQISERFNYLNTNEQQTIITDIFGPNGEIIRTDTSYLTFAHQYVTTNQFHLIDIPFMVGYEFHADNLTLAISGGPVFNLRLGKKGEFLSPDDLEPISFNEDQPNSYPAFRDQVGLGWQGNLGLYYEMGNRVDLLFEPYFRLYPQSFSLPDYPVRQRYFMAGIGIGLRVAL